MFLKKKIPLFINVAQLIKNSAYQQNGTFNVMCHLDRTGDAHEPARKFNDDKMAKRLGKRKVDSECRVFNPKWTSDYFFVQCKEMAVCLICQETVSVFKEYNLRWHYETRHREKYASLQGQMRADKVSKLKSGLSVQQKTFAHQIQLNQSSVRASFQVAKLIATSGRPFSDGEFVKKRINAAAEEVYPDKNDVLNVVSLSASIITKRIEEMGDNVYAQLQEKVKK